MKTIVCAGKVLGVYQSVATLASGDLSADGTLLPLAALGAFTVVDGAPPSVAHTWSGTAWIAPPPPPVAVPQAVTRKQARAAMAQSIDANGISLLSKVQPAINAIADPIQRALMQIEFDDSPTFERQRPALLQLAAALSLSSTDVDNLFIWAAGIQ